MSNFTKHMVDIASPVDAAGNPRKVPNGEMQVWGTEVERLIQIATSNGDLLVYDSLSALNADLDHSAHTGAILIGESIADDGLYMKQGASGSGSWVKIGNVPGQGFVKATNAGAGTANAIEATTPVAVNETQLILLPITTANTASPVTVAFNGGAALTVKTVSGNDVVVGGLPAGSVMLGVVQGGDFRLLSDQASAGIQAAAEAARDAAEQARDDAQAAQAAAESAASANLSNADSRSAAVLTNFPGSVSYVRTAGYASAGDRGGALYRRVVSEPSHAGKFQSADGAWWELSESVVNYAMFGADLTGVTVADAEMAAAHEYANAKNAKVVQKWGTVLWRSASSVVKTDCDLAGLTVNLDSASGNPSPVYGSPITYDIQRSTPAYELSVSEIAEFAGFQSDLNTGSLYCRHTAFTERPYSLVRVETSLTDVMRNGVTAVPQKDYFTIGQSGVFGQEIVRPVYDSITDVFIYPREDRRLTFRSPKFYLDSAKSLRAIRIERNQVKLQGVVIDEPVPDTGTIKSLINVQHSWDVEIDGLIASNPDLTQGGAYALLAEGVVGLRIKNAEGWGFGSATGTNWLKDVVFEDSVLNRVDAHWSGHDFKLERCTIVNRGVSACGGGHWALRDCKWLLTSPPNVSGGEQLGPAFFQPRGDYGYHFDGTVTVEGLEIVIGREVTLSDLSRISVVKIGNEVTYDLAKDTKSPDRITVRDVRCRMPGNFTTASGQYFRMIGVDLSNANINGPSRSWFYPSFIEVDGLFFEPATVSQRLLAMGVAGSKYASGSVKCRHIRIGNSTYGTNAVVKVSRCASDLSPTTDNFLPTGDNGTVSLIQDISAWAAVSNYANAWRPLVVVDDCPSAVVEATVRGKVVVKRSVLRRLQNGRGGTAVAGVLVEGCDIRPLDTTGPGVPANYTLETVNALFVGNEFFQPVNADSSFSTAVDLAGAKGIGNIGRDATPGVHYTNAPANFFL
ncbi:hypothetical protein JYP49_14390 [Nitratireductor aquimarinus]|uniref:hypothetical protein n=1 Tax=Nitratireductor TaxID=245876 RepID=UPI0019D3FA88|nr:MULTISPECIES: hypothetical protein [Nitratireductor]MBN7777786.1 hypothetical protein [Nitratireductor pacificus]MBN7781780.1 hypothetical protein [Nitratireductor pacificus]MBN7790586.1 hypothetical protein [Nitratireductor aquimarinus]MBY6099996.1 hypothetical protein [Nitratireductor aquimarinus]MCA1260460.1 hypothetical protein [Nitratireductor aquimarinus]